MGRQRRLQRQSARLWYKNHDHREIILNGEYINAVYVPSEHYYMDKDVAWRKYKPLTLLCFSRSMDEYDSEHLLSVDVANKFVSISSDMSSNTLEPCNYGDSMILCSDYFSKNGYDYKAYSEFASGYSIDYRFAKQYLYTYEYDSSLYKHTLSWKGFNWNANQQYASFTPTLGTVTMTDAEHYSNLSICGEARDGLFAYRTWTVRIGSQYPYTYHHYIELYHINSSGFTLVYSDDYTDSTQGLARLYPTNIFSHGNQYCGVTRWRNNSTQGVRIWWSINGSSWDYHDLINEVSGALRPMRVMTLYRNNKWYWYIHLQATNSTVKWLLYTATDLSDDDTYVNVALPNYLDIPMLGYDDGIHGEIQDCDGEYVRIILNNYDPSSPIPAEQGETYYMSPMGEKLADTSQYDHRYFSINNGYIHYDPTNTYLDAYITEEWDNFFAYFYIDNMTFQTSSNNFAFKFTPPSDPWEVTNHEIVADDDYVWGNNNNA